MYCYTYTEIAKGKPVEALKQIVENKILFATSSVTSVAGGVVVNSVEKSMEPTLMEIIATNAVAIGAICISIQTCLAVLKFGLDRYLKRKERKKAERDTANRDITCPK